LEACLLSPEKSKDTALFFFTVLCVTKWLSSSDENNRKIF
jgi:hypothetical protein